MPLLKCVGCKGRFPKDSMIRLPIGNVHNIECATKYAQAKQQKQRDRQLAKTKKAIKKKNATRKREFYDNDIKTRKAAAKKACHDYIKFRDKDEPTCICCHRPLKGAINAGHWLESGNNPVIRYNEDNIHSQLVYCNNYQGGDSGDYEKNLRLKIGDDKVDYLLSQRGHSIKRTTDDYKKIESHFKHKLKDLATIVN